MQDGDKRQRRVPGQSTCPRGTSTACSTMPGSVPPLPASAFEGWRGTRPARRAPRASKLIETGWDAPILGTIVERARWLLDIIAAQA